jgi:hypothetical protein
MINKINIAEIVLFVVFTLSYFFQESIPSHWRWVSLLLYFLLGVLYFPLGFYTLKSSKFKTIYSVFFGMLFTLALTAILLSLMKVALSIFLLWLSIVLYFMIAGIQAIAFYVYSKTEGQIVMYDLGITIRYLAFLGLMIYASITFNFNIV